MGKKLLVFIGSILVSFGAGALGTLATIPNIPTWYAALEKPPLNPPNWIFGPVWTTLYLLMGIALALVIITRTRKSKTGPYVWFAIQLALNTAWSLVFFGMHSTVLGMVIIMLLIVSIVMTMIEFSQIKRASAWLLAPYLAWVCFATYLNIGIAVLNG